MTKVATITLTREQDAALIARYNEYAKSPLKPNQGFLVFHEESDFEIETQGFTTVEISQYETENGKPFVFDIDESEVTVEWSDIS